MNPAVKNYLIFSTVIAGILAFILNFVLLANLKNSYVYGFPISLMDAEGFGFFLINLINTVIATLFFTPAVYLAIQWLQSRGRQ